MSALCYPAKKRNRYDAYCLGTRMYSLEVTQTWSGSTLASHKLNVIAIVKPVKQKIRRFHPDRHLIV